MSDNIDEFLAGLDLDTDDESEPIVEKKDTIEDGYGSVSYQVKELLKSNPDAKYKVVDCVVYIYDEDTSTFYEPYNLHEMGKLDNMGDPIWEDDEMEEIHNELKEKYNQNIKNKAGSFSGCY
tara:strand:- start:922 stop:1287 length:366 start_codon:yes stop_codon:yes gene_type:complete